MSQGTIGRYRIVRNIGKGGMAQVYQAHDPVFERDVALKVILDVFSDVPEFREGFRQEAKTIAKLEHRAIVPVYDFGEDGDKLYLIMRLMPGESLRDRLNREKRISPEEASLILNRLAAALDEAHAQGVIHRDIKPANVLLDKDGLSFLSDFGIAHIAEETDVTNGRLSREDGYVGSPAYMAPEQWLKEQPGSYTDVYQLGIMLFEMLTGEQPYQGTSRSMIKERHLNQALPSAKAINPDLPRDCDRVLATALNKDPFDRFSTPGEMAEAFARILNPEKIDNRYVLQEELTHGSHAALFLARDVEQEIDVALKKFKAPLLSYPTFQRQFRQLADRLPQLVFPTLLPVLQIGVDHNRPYLVMPFVNDGSLRQRLQDDGRFSIEQVYQMLTPLGKSIDEAAGQGFIHRDIKPSNILLDNDGACFVSDFGALDVVELTETVIHSQEIVGSYPYMAPEQWRCEELDGRTNVYQFGVMVYELLTGVRPFSASSYEGWMEKHLHEPVPDICQLVPDLPPACNDIFHKALAKERDGRYATVTEFITILRQTYSDHVIESLYEQGLTLYRQGDWEDAIKRLEQVASLNPNYRNVRAYITRANEDKRRNYIYEKGKSEYAQRQWKETVYWLKQIPGYRDADVLLKEAKEHLEPTARSSPAKKLIIAGLVALVLIVLTGGGYLLLNALSFPANTPPLPTVPLTDCLASADIYLEAKNRQSKTGLQVADQGKINLVPGDVTTLEVLLNTKELGCGEFRDKLSFDWRTTQPGTLQEDPSIPYEAVYTPEKVDSITVYIRAGEADEPRSIRVGVQPSG